MDLETKYCSVDGALALRDDHIVEGYASLFGVCDQGGDTVVRGAYQRSIERLAAKGTRIKMLWQHDQREPIGVWDEVREDDRGLLVKGRLLTDLPRGREAATLICAGAIDGLSIGYRTVQAAKAGGGRELCELELWEVSIVTFPMLAEARVSAKSEVDAQGELRDLTEFFRDARRLVNPG